MMPPSVQQVRTENEHDDAVFIRHQLQFFLALCKGRNHQSIRAITSEFMSYDVMFHIVRSMEIPQDVRAMVSDLLVGKRTR